VSCLTNARFIIPQTSLSFSTASASASSSGDSKKSCSSAKSGSFIECLRRWHFKTAGYGKMGLKKSDLLVERPLVEASRELVSEDLKQDRIKRIIIAQNEDTRRHRECPKELQISFEDDTFVDVAEHWEGVEKKDINNRYESLNRIF